MSEFPALPYCCDHSVQMSKKASVATAANKKAKSSYFQYFLHHCVLSWMLRSYRTCVKMTSCPRIGHTRKACVFGFTTLEKAIDRYCLNYAPDACSSPVSARPRCVSLPPPPHKNKPVHTLAIYRQWCYIYSDAYFSCNCLINGGWQVQEKWVLLRIKCSRIFEISTPMWLRRLIQMLFA